MIKSLMTWEPAKARWRKMHKGKVYTVSCEALGTPGTKEASYQAANAWWKEKLRELDTGWDAFRTAHPYHPHESRILILERRRDQARKDGNPDEADRIEAEIEAVRCLGPGEQPSLDRATLLNMRAFEAMGGKLPENLPVEYAEEWFGSSKEWRTRYATTTQIAEDQSVGGQVERFMGVQRDRAASGEISASEYDLIRNNLDVFRDWIGAKTPVEAIVADRWESWYRHVLNWDASVESKKKRYRYPRNFVWWLVEKGVIAAPPNLHSRRYRFKGGTKKVPTMTVEEVQHLIEAAPGQLKLHLLLMANCGMGQVDISDLVQTEVDWEENRIIRKRSKTDDHEDVPIVNYKLWPITATLLRQYRSEGEAVLQTRSGRRWVRDGLKSDGKRKKVDAIKSNYTHIQRRLKFDKPMKLIRKTSATLIEGNKEYAAYSSHFLGHSPRSIKDRSYAAPSEAIFDEAVLWLGRVYGFVRD